MMELEVGNFVVSTAGHDLGNYYVIINKDDEYIYLVDGKIKRINRPKKKKRKHIRKINYVDPSLTELIKNSTVRDEEIKRSIKLRLNGDSGKEVE